MTGNGAGGISTVRSLRGFPSIEIVEHRCGASLVRKAEDATPENYVRDLILAHAKGKVADLPYLIHDIAYGTPASDWYCALTSDNPPGKCRFAFRGNPEGYQAFRDSVLAIDFTAYDPATASAIRSQHSAAARPADIAFDAADAELEVE